MLEMWELLLLLFFTQCMHRLRDAGNWVTGVNDAVCA